jgi:hypothetical protein
MIVQEDCPVVESSIVRTLSTLIVAWALIYAINANTIVLVRRRVKVGSVPNILLHGIWVWYVKFSIPQSLLSTSQIPPQKCRVCQ